uniref:NadR/Ttd14 AAA domain-containing protein n=1 Tax=Ditylenchus dipsaci TaxID=166011 RepID=A0A915D989_9BILA
MLGLPFDHHPNRSLTARNGLEPLQIDSNNNKRSKEEQQNLAYLCHCTSSQSKNCCADNLPTSDYSSGAEECNIASAYDFRKASISSNQLRSDLIQMATEADPSKSPRVYKLVLTGGPCGGKTTGQDRLATFFENMGWKVFTVPEAATVLLRGGVKFTELSAPQTYEFQKDLLLTLLQIEKVFFNQAELIKDRNVLIICDRGAMDPSAYMDCEGWERVLKDAGLNIFDLRETATIR